MTFTVSVCRRKHCPAQGPPLRLPLASLGRDRIPAETQPTGADPRQVGWLGGRVAGTPGIGQPQGQCDTADAPGGSLWFHVACAQDVCPWSLLTVCVNRTVHVKSFLSR